MICQGSYREGIRAHPEAGAAECPTCGLRFDRERMAGEPKRNVPGHSPWPQELMQLVEHTK